MKSGSTMQEVTVFTILYYSMVEKKRLEHLISYVVCSERTVRQKESTGGQLSGPLCPQEKVPPPSPGLSVRFSAFSSFPLEAWAQALPKHACH